MENTNNNQEIASHSTEVIQMISDIIDEKQRQNKERIGKMFNAITELSANIREAACFVRPLITEAAWYSVNHDTEDIKKLLYALPMINKIFDKLVTEAEKAEEL